MVTSGGARWRDANTELPAAGGPVDRLSGGGSLAVDGSFNYRPGATFRMDCGGAFVSGAELATDGNGRAVQASSGDLVVARALEGSSGAGDTARCVWASYMKP